MIWPWPTGRSAVELEHDVWVLLAVKLYELHRVSMGLAAEIAGGSKQGFMDELARLKGARRRLRPRRSRRRSRWPVRLVVADSGPLIALARIGRLETVPAPYERVPVPEAALVETTELGHASGDHLRTADWL